MSIVVTDVSFDSDLKMILPRLRVYAMSLTHNKDLADDLVQRTAVKALAGRHSFRPGSSFSSWIFRIERNEFISELRRTRPTVNIDDVTASVPSCPPRQENGLVMREFLGAFLAMDIPASSAMTRALLGWQPTQPGLLADLDAGHYSNDRVAEAGRRP